MGFASSQPWVARLAAKRQGHLDEELERIARLPLIVVDDIGCIPFDLEAAALIFALVNSSDERSSIIVSSNKTGARMTDIERAVRKALAECSLSLVARCAVTWVWARAAAPILRVAEHNKPRARDNLVIARSRLLRVPVVHAIGDSHANVLSGVWPFVVHHIGPVTAYNLASPSSTTQGRARLLDALRLADPHKDIVLLIAGEIDCRIHIYDRHVRSSHALSLEELARRTVMRYCVTIQMLRARGYRVAVQSAVGGVHEANIYGYPHFGDVVVRGHIAQLFNSDLEAWCRENEVDYVDLFSHVTDDRGVLNRSMASDGVHLNRQAALPLYGPWLREAVHARWVAPRPSRGKETPIVPRPHD